MIILTFLLPISVLLGGLFLGLYFWAVRAGQYEDLETPPYRVLTHDQTDQRRKQQ